MKFTHFRNRLKNIKEETASVKIAETISIDEMRDSFHAGEIFNVRDIVQEGEAFFEILDRGSNYVFVSDDNGNIQRKFIDGLTTVQIGESVPESVTGFKKYKPTETFLENQAIVEAFTDTIELYNSGEITDAIAILKAIKQTDLLVNLAEADGNVSKIIDAFSSAKASLSRIGQFATHKSYLEELARTEAPIVQHKDKLKVAKIIADTLGVNPEGSNAEQLVNNGLRAIKKKGLHAESIAIVKHMLELADEVGILYDKKLLPSVSEEFDQIESGTIAPTYGAFMKKIKGKKGENEITPDPLQDEPTTEVSPTQDTSKQMGHTLGANSDGHRHAKIRKMTGR